MSTNEVNYFGAHPRVGGSLGEDAMNEHEHIDLSLIHIYALGVELARLAAGEKKGSLTLAPEAGTQRMRDVINKGEMCIRDRSWAVRPTSCLFPSC